MPFPIESIEQMQGFFWILMRISILIFMMPLFGARGVPFLWKAGLSMVLTFVLLPVVPPPGTLPQTMSRMALGLAGEVLLGLILAFPVRIIFASAQLAGQIMSFQMGFAMARTIDPNTGIQSTALSQFLYLFTVLVFFATDGHHLLIRGITASFHLVPPNQFSPHSALPQVLVKISSDMFIIGLKIAAPIVIALFLSNLGLGIVARTVPQVNILMIGFPINIGIGMILFGLIFKNLSPFLIERNHDIVDHMLRLLRMM
jgi:flagellar biosynthetic protein FliR